jgi:hypothetical protein
VQLEVAHHVELGHRTPELGVDDLVERLQNLVTGGSHEGEVSSWVPPSAPQAGGRLLAGVTRAISSGGGTAALRPPDFTTG